MKNKPLLDGKIESDQIIRIAGRASSFARKCGHKINTIDLAISLSVCHAHRALRLDELEQFDDGNLGHDVFGIHRYLNSMTGELTECFVPRCGFQN